MFVYVSSMQIKSMERGMNLSMSLEIFEIYS